MDIENACSELTLVEKVIFSSPSVPRSSSHVETITLSVTSYSFLYPEVM